MKPIHYLILFLAGILLDLLVRAVLRGMKNP